MRPHEAGDRDNLRQTRADLIRIHARVVLLHLRRGMPADRPHHEVVDANGPPEVLKRPPHEARGETLLIPAAFAMCSSGRFRHDPARKPPSRMETGARSAEAQPADCPRATAGSPSALQEEGREAADPSLSSP